VAKLIGAVVVALGIVACTAAVVPARVPAPLRYIPDDPQLQALLRQEAEERACWRRGGIWRRGSNPPQCVSRRMPPSIADAGVARGRSAL
jgi:hypothetical protein